jgi:hypothetical protein
MSTRDRTYASFEELERDEFRRMETLGATVDEMIEAIFGDDVRTRSTSVDDDDLYDDEV